MFDPFTKAGALIRRLQQISLRVFSEATAPFDLSTVQFGALQVIGDRPGIDQASLGQASDTDRTTVIRVVDRLQQRGLIRREPCPHDRRLNRLYVTSAGTQLIAGMAPLADSSQVRLLDPLSPDEREAFMRMLTKLVLAHSPPERATKPSSAQAQDSESAAIA